MSVDNIDDENKENDFDSLCTSQSTSSSQSQLQSDLPCTSSSLLSSSAITSPPNPKRKDGLCCICIFRNVQLAVCPCGHCYCNSCWQTMVTQHKEKIHRNASYDFSDSDDDFEAPASVNLRGGAYPQCPYCKQDVKFIQTIFLT